MPCGNQCFHNDNEIDIHLFYKNINEKNIEILNCNAFDILKSITKNEKQFIYLDPPYSNTTAIYNENRAFGGWSLQDDYKLFNELDRLNALGIKWAMSNVLENKGKENYHIKEWVEKNNYVINDIEYKSYASFGKGNANSREVLITNYEPTFKAYNIFDFI